MESPSKEKIAKVVIGADRTLQQFVADGSRASLFAVSVAAE